VHELHEADDRRFGQCEAFAWLRGEGADSARLRDPGIMARLARRVLMRVSGLPSLRLEERTRRFTVR
jgi:hypothetical protein